MKDLRVVATGAQVGPFRLVIDKVLCARSPSVEPGMIGVLRRIRFYDTDLMNWTWIFGWDYPVLVCVGVWVCAYV